MLLFALGAARGGFTATESTLRLTGLPEKAHVYIDGHAVTPEKGLIRVAPGWRSVQVEALAGDRIVATHRKVEAQAGKTHVLWLTPRPVVAVGRVVTAPGPRGPRGPTSPPAPAPEDMQLTADSPVSELRSRLDNSLWYELHALWETGWERQRSFEPEAYWYDPHAEATVGPPGPPGPRGRHGRPMPSSYTTIIEAADGQPLWPRIERALGITDVFKELAAVTEELNALRSAPSEPHEPNAWVARRRIDIRTPAFRARLETERERALAPGAPPILVPGPPGLRGPTNGGLVIERPIRVIRLSDERVRELLKSYAEDNRLRRTITELRTLVDDLKLRAAEAEARQKVCSPKPGTPAN
jgi:hypothetical protein